MNRFLLPLLGITLLATPLRAEDSKVPDFGLTPKDEMTRPVLSAGGKKRLQENVKTLENNLRDLKENLAVADKNLETIKAELKDLDNLEWEHQDLKKRYEAYLAKASKEMASNEKAKRDLAKWEASNRNTPKDALAGALKDKMESSRQEQAERDRWAIDAQSKTARVRQLLDGLGNNLRDIKSRRKPLEQQSATWTTRREEYVKAIADAETKKAQWEKALVR